MFWYQLYLFLFLVSFVLTAYLRTHALKSNSMDIPNERSSHVIPTPRGGGLAFVLCFMIGVGLVAWKTDLPHSLAYALVLMGIGTGGLGWVDDHYSLSAGFRFIAQLLFAVMSLYILNVFEYLWWGESFLALIYVVGMINLFNFMDGIDGYAVMESGFICAVVFLLSFETAFVFLGPVMGCLLAVLIGFGVWNFPTAKIFMGDVGSGFLGGIFGVISLFILVNQPAYLGSWLILIALFMSDGAVTLLVRIVRGERFWMAHRQHAYQHLTQTLGSHVVVTLGGLLINLCWLFPLAWLVIRGSIAPLWGVAMAYVPLIGAVLYLKAGRV